MRDFPQTELATQTNQLFYELLLFVAGQETNSNLARQNLEAFCREELDDRYRLQVIDVFEDHRPALEHRVLVTPCLVMVAPLPTAMIAGTLHDKDKMRAALRLPKEQ